jgi:hypothetical protein
LQVGAASNSKDGDGLAVLLRSASMEDKTIIMTFTNEALSLPGSLLEILVDVRVSVRIKGNKGNRDDVVAINTKVDKVSSW